MKTQDIKLRGAFERLDDWIRLPRNIDKIRLQPRVQLPPDSIECLGTRTDGL